MIESSQIPLDCFYELRNDIPWVYQMRYLNMWQIVHALATIDDDVDLSDANIRSKLVCLHLAAKRLDDVIPKPKTKADSPNEREPSDS